VLLAPERDVPAEYYEAVGYRALGGCLIRIDMLERFAAQVRALARHGPFAAPPALGALLGATAAETGAMLEALGLRATVDEGGTVYASAPRRGRGKPRRSGPPVPDSPFAALRRQLPAQ